MVVCRIVSPDGRVHVMKGMIREFQVEARGSAGSAAFPVASDTITLKDYGFVSRRPLERGRHTVRVENAGPQPHEIVMLALKPGKPPNFSTSGRSAPSTSISLRASTGSSASYRMPRTGSGISSTA